MPAHRGAPAAALDAVLQVRTAVVVERAAVIRETTAVTIPIAARKGMYAVASGAARRAIHAVARGNAAGLPRNVWVANVSLSKV